MRERGKYLTYVIIAINVIMYLISAYFSNNILDIDINVLVFLGAKFNPLIAAGQYYRLLTCTFLHAGIVHLGLNMYALYDIGTLIEDIYGRLNFIFIYIISGIVSSIFSYMFSINVSIGASGAIFGLLGAALVVAIKMKHIIGEQFKRSIISVILINIIIGLSIPNIDNFGHIGGLIGGIIVSLIIFKKKEHKIR